MALRILLVSAVVLLLSAFGAEAAKKVTVVEDLSSGLVTRFDKSGKSVSNAINPGDTYLWDAPLLNPSSKKQVGTVTGNLVYSAKGRSISTLTAEWTGVGSITVSGVYADAKAEQIQAITGGTGAFAKATGYVKITSPAGGDKYEFYIN